MSQTAQTFIHCKMEKLRYMVFLLLVCVWNCGNAQIKLNPKFSFNRDFFRPLPDCLGCPIKPDITPNEPKSQLDVVFIMDTTGSMSPYIENVRNNIRRFVDELTASLTSDVNMALIEYRDHPPQDHTFITRKHEFSSSATVVKSWLDAAKANGGGDKPEAVADALYDATKLSWRQSAVKIGVLISDAPPHGLSPSEDSSFPDGCPLGHDPIDLTHQLVKLGVTMYSVGCEPSILPYKDFFMALAYVTGGQYIPLSDPQSLIDAIIGGAREEISLKGFSKDVQQEIQKVQAAGLPINKDQIAQTVFTRLSSSGAKSTQLLRNNRPLQEATPAAKAIAAAKSMAEVRKIFVKGSESPTPSIPIGGGSRPFILPRLGIGIDFAAAPDMAMSGSIVAAAGDSAAAAAGAAGAGSEKFSAVESAISLDQINRLVNKQTAKLTV